MSIAGKCDRNLAMQSNIFRSHSDGIPYFSVWGQDVISISRNKIALTSLSRPASDVRLYPSHNLRHCLISKKKSLLLPIEVCLLLSNLRGVWAGNLFGSCESDFHMLLCRLDINSLHFRICIRLTEEWNTKTFLFFQLLLCFHCQDCSWLELKMDSSKSATRYF